MQKTESFPSIHTRCYSYNGQICSLYEIGQSLSHIHLSKIVKSLQAQGYPVESLEFYEYGNSDTLRHLFIKLKGEENLIPYFQLEKEIWLAIIKELVASIQ